jgi:hypothetical protein
MRIYTGGANRSRDLTLDGGTTLTTANGLVIPADTVWQFDIHLSMLSESGIGATWHIRGGIRRSGNATAILGTVNSLSWWDEARTVTVTADDTNEMLKITVDQGGSSLNHRWVAAVDIVQVSFGTP